MEQELLEEEVSMNVVSLSKVGRLRWAGLVAGGAIFGFSLVAAPGCGGTGNSNTGGIGPFGGTATLAQVLRGRDVVATHACANCHAQAKNDPNSGTWMAGWTGGQAPGSFQLGPFTVNASNLTPDATGIVAFTPLQIYNALKHGLDPANTPSVVITGDTPGVGNFPSTPHYLAPIMPWNSWRHMTDDDLWATVAYLKHGIKPVSNAVPAGTEPPDFWASSVTPNIIGPAKFPLYPATNEAFNP
jgi:hypothetical protein